MNGLTSPDFVYEAAMQVSDFGLAGIEPVRLRVYQRSATVGRGLPATADIFKLRFI